MKVFRLPFKKSLLGIYTSRLLKGCLFLLTILVAVSNYDISNKNLVNYILTAFVAMTITDIYCNVIGDQINMRKTITMGSFRHLIWEWFPQMLPGVLGALICSMAFVGLISKHIAFAIIETGCIVTMIVCCYVSQRICSHRGWRALYPTLIAAGLGILFIFFRGLMMGVPRS